MRDELARVHLKGPDLLVVAVQCTEAARRARQLHHLMPTSAGLLAQGIAAGYGIAALLGGNARINLQLSCDGPIKTLFVDADAEGHGRGYVKNPSVNFLTQGAPHFDATPALGTTGMLSVLRELKDHEFYRGSVALEHFDLARDLERYYRESEQIETLVALDVRPVGEESLGQVTGFFAQLLPNGDPAALQQLRASLRARTDQPLPERTLYVIEALAGIFPGSEHDLLAEYPVSYHCGCSHERVLRAVMAMGRGEIEDMLATEGRAVATCAFCGAVYEVTGDQLRAILKAADELEDDTGEEPN